MEEEREGLTYSIHYIYRWY